MHRRPRPDNPRLETLLDERDHIRIQISMLQDAPVQEPARLKELREQLEKLERYTRGYRQTY